MHGGLGKISHAFAFKAVYLVTYCLGWKTSRAIFFLADSAITSNRFPRAGTSSFGESHITANPLCVEQAALKIYPIGRAGITFAGDVQLGRALVSDIRNLLIRGMRPIDAVQQALINISPIPKNRILCAIFGAFTESGPELWSYASSSRQSEFEPVSDIVQYGSINDAHKSLSADFIRELTMSDRLFSIEILASVLGLIQSYGIHNALMEKGVGGHFTGAYIDSDGSHWQPDILFMLYDSASPMKMNCVSSLIRENVHAIGSSISKDVRCFADHLSDIQVDQWRQKWGIEVQEKSKTGNFDFIVFLDTRYWRVVVVEMAGQNMHRHLQFYTTSMDKGNTVFSPYLAEILQKSMEGNPMNMNFLEFEPFGEGQPDLNAGR